MRPQTASASFARPANTTQYAVGDLVANNATAGSVAALNFPQGPIIVRRVRVTKDDDDVTAATFRVHFFKGNPVSSAPANGDNGAISLNTDINEYLGSYDVDMTSAPDIYNTAGNVGVGVPLNGSELIVPQYRTAAWSETGTYALIEARATYTPASGETFTVEIEYLV